MLNAPAYGDDHEFKASDEDICVFVEGYAAELGYEFYWGVCGPKSWCSGDTVKFINYQEGDWTSTNCAEGLDIDASNKIMLSILSASASLIAISVL